MDDEILERLYVRLDNRITDVLNKIFKMQRFMYFTLLIISIVITILSTLFYTNYKKQGALIIKQSINNEGSRSSVSSDLDVQQKSDVQQKTDVQQKSGIKVNK